MRGAEPRAGRVGREGEADERRGRGRSGKEVAGEGGMELGNPAGAPAASPQPGGRMRQQSDPITSDLSETRPGLHSVFCKNSLPGK